MLFFKQKTAYEMRIRDWSSDVCSSELRGEQGALAADGAALGREDSGRDCAGVGNLVAGHAAGGGSEKPVGVIEQLREDERGLRVIGRLSARTAVGREAAALLKAGAVDGLSFGYRVREIGRASCRERVCQYG